MTKVTQFDDKGNIISISYGPTDEELLEAHNNNTCDVSCGYCYKEFCDLMDSKYNQQN